MAVGFGPHMGTDLHPRVDNLVDYATTELHPRVNNLVDYTNPQARMAATPEPRDGAKAGTRDTDDPETFWTQLDDFFRGGGAAPFAGYLGSAMMEQANNQRMPQFSARGFGGVPQGGPNMSGMAGLNQLAKTFGGMG